MKKPNRTKKRTSKKDDLKPELQPSFTLGGNVSYVVSTVLVFAIPLIFPQRKKGLYVVLIINMNTLYVRKKRGVMREFYRPNAQR